MQTNRALVDWVAEEGLDRPSRQIDDWTAGDDLDFTVRSRRRRITSTPAGEHGQRQQQARESRTIHLVGATEPAESRADAVRADAHALQGGVVELDRGRRTVAVTGRPDQLRDVPRLRELEQRRRATRTPSERAASSPDRIAMWAVFLGFVLIVIASLSS